MSSIRPRGGAAAAAGPSRNRRDGRRTSPRTALEGIKSGRLRIVGEADRLTLPRSRRLANALFAVTPLLYVAQQLLTHPRAILGGEMWAEMATNYYATSQWSSIWQQLLAVDVGYIPLPQRLIGLVGAGLGLSASAIPYFYTGTAILISAVLVGSICLPVFRPLIPSDLLRFTLALTVLVSLDWETRLYINFTYLAVVPLVFLGALAFTGCAVPAWAWVVPVFVISKPAVLAAVPAVLLGAAFSGRRFRIIGILSLLAAVLQLIRLAISSTLPGALLQPGVSSSPLQKLIVGIQYAAAFPGRLVLDPNGGISPEVAMIIGASIIAAFLAIAVLRPCGASALIVSGLGLVVFDMLLNAVVYSDTFGGDLSMINVVPIDRRVVVAMLGTFIAAAGVVSALTEGLTRSSTRRPLSLDSGDGRGALVRTMRAAAIIVFVAWMIATGWFRYFTAINAPGTAPVTDVSQWQALAPAITPQSTICVPVAPFGWAYGQNCSQLAGQMPAELEFREVTPQARGARALALDVPAAVREQSLAAVAVLVQPVGIARSVSADLIVTTVAGDRVVLHAEAAVPLSGGSLLFEQVPIRYMQRVRSVAISFDAPARLGWAQVDGVPKVSAIWMGS